MTIDKNTTDQRRAADALSKIRSIADGGNDGMYISYISAMPATVVMNGLGQALITQLAKSKPSNRLDSHGLIYQHLCDWLSKQVKGLEGKPDQLIDRLMENDQSVYILAQAECMAYLNWLKQFARALLAEAEGDR